MEMNDQVAIVTGAASGIGRAIARRFARAGARVVLADLDRGAAAATAREIDADPRRAVGIAMDVADERAVDSGVAEVISQFGRIDVLVSNAGIQIVHPLEEFSYAEWKKMLAIHLDGAFLTTRACLPHMYRAGRGSLIYMGSVHSKLASVLKAPYVTAKHGLIGLAKTMAKEGAAHGVRANVICPGFVRTPLVERQIPEQSRTLGISEEDVIRKVMLKDTVDGEFTTLDDVADVALFFAAFPSNALTGQSLVVSHGWYMQ
ncbi:MAG TPA: 3-hydroxybutyrate dehydrogenase [Casimicrobiaceae bacterium]|nr:3-hydroxybutyrate dehydrogenase [Casimicrobiaceae bacterium]